MSEEKQKVKVTEEKRVGLALPEGWRMIRLEDGTAYIGSYITPYGEVPGLIKFSENKHIFYYRWKEKWRKRCFVGRPTPLQGILAIERWLTKVWNTLQEDDV